MPEESVPLPENDPNTKALVGKLGNLLRDRDENGAPGNARTVVNGNELLSDFERKVDAILNSIGLDHITQHHISYIDRADGATHIYTPDFDLGQKYNGKTVILEPHGGDFFDYEFIRKMRRFMESSSHDDYYLVIITEKPLDEIKAMLAKTRVSRRSDEYFPPMDISNICDKLVNTRKLAQEELQQPYKIPDEMAGKPYAIEAAQLSEELGGDGKFDQTELIRALMEFKRDGTMS